LEDKDICGMVYEDLFYSLLKYELPARTIEGT